MQEDPFNSPAQSMSSSSKHNDVQMDAYGILIKSKLFITDTNEDTERKFNGYSKLYTTGAGPCHVICAVAHDKAGEIFAKALFHKPDGNDVKLIKDMIMKIIDHDSSKEVAALSLYLFAGSSFSREARNEIHELIDKLKEKRSTQFKITFEDHKETEIDNTLFSPESGINKITLQKLIEIEKYKLANLKEERSDLTQEIDGFENKLTKLKEHYLEQNNDNDAEFIKIFKSKWDSFANLLNETGIQNTNSIDEMDVEKSEGEEEEEGNEEGNFFYICNEIKSDVHMDNNGITIYQHDFNASLQRFVQYERNVFYNTNTIDKSETIEHAPSPPLSPTIMQHWKPTRHRFGEKEVEHENTKTVGNKRSHDSIAADSVTKSEIKPETEEKSETEDTNKRIRPEPQGGTYHPPNPFGNPSGTPKYTRDK